MEDIIQKIHNYSLEEIMGERFGRYAKYIIQDRAIPDVRDGLKPVQRRILFAMYKNKNTYDHDYVKSALTVGDVIGKYHPHGDSSVYEAMVRMSQDWKQRAVYIDFQGNNGSIDGDSPAAYRYTEARLARISNEMLRDIDKNTVLMAPTFDDTRLEPTVLPSRFPNLLLNGTTGISAGYATNIPPHNLGEIIDATIKRIDTPNCRLETILDIIKGPDFPTGGIALGQEGMNSAYTTGKGRIIVRSKYEFTKSKGKEQLVITQIPYEVLKSALVKKIDEIRIDKKIDGITEVRDESDKDGLRIVVDLKSGIDQKLIINYLLKNTDLQVSYNYNMVAIVNRRPKLLGILPIIDAYIAYQKEVVTKRTEFDLAASQKEIHILSGLIKALSILDELIATIRASKNKADAKQNIIAAYEFSEEQAEAIVTLQLYKLTNTDVAELQMRFEELQKRIELYESILGSEEILNKVLKRELTNIKKEYDTPRKTKIVAEVSEIKIDAKEMIAKEKVVVVVTNDGYLKRVSAKSYSQSDSEETLLKPGDYVTACYEVSTLDNILLFTSQGRYLFIPVHTIGETKWRELGKHVNNLVLIAPTEKIIGSLVIDNPQATIIMYTKAGYVKQSILEDFIVSRYSKPMIAIKLKANDELISVQLKTKRSLLVTNNGYYLQFSNDEIPLVGVRASGVKGINLKDDYLVSGLAVNEDDDITIFTDNKTAKRLHLSELNIMSRAKKGSLIMKKVKSVNYHVIKSLITNSKTTFYLKKDETFTELKASDIPLMDTLSTGSIITKHKVDDVFISWELQSFIKKATPEIKESREQKPKEMTIDDFINDFRL